MNLTDDLETQRDLITRAQGGDLTALRPIFEAFSPLLYKVVILPRTGSPALAEDVLRETIATAIMKINTFRWQSRSIYLWLRRIAVNKSIDAHRKRKRFKKLQQSLFHESNHFMHGEPMRADLQLIATEERKLNRARIESTLKKLRPRYRQTLEERLIQGSSREECASRLGVSTATFDVIFHRAIRAFRKHWE